MATHQQLIDISTPRVPPITQHQMDQISWPLGPLTPRGCGTRHTGPCPGEESR